MPVAAFRRSPEHDELTKLAEQHFAQDLTEDDRVALRKAASTVSNGATIGSLIGLGLGLFMAFRLRSARMAVFTAFRAAERPTQVVFSNGRAESIPDLTPLMRPSRIGDIATYLLCGLGGLFVGGEGGFAMGAWRASKSIRQEPGRNERVEAALRKFKIDYLRQQADQLERGAASPWDQTF